MHDFFRPGDLAHGHDVGIVGVRRVDRSDGAVERGAAHRVPLPEVAGEPVERACPRVGRVGGANTPGARRSGSRVPRRRSARSRCRPSRPRVRRGASRHRRRGSNRPGRRTGRATASAASRVADQRGKLREPRGDDPAAVEADGRAELSRAATRETSRDRRSRTRRSRSGCRRTRPRGGGRASASMSASTASSPPTSLKNSRTCSNFPYSTIEPGPERWNRSGAIAW